MYKMYILYKNIIHTLRTYNICCYWVSGWVLWERGEGVILSMIEYIIHAK